MKHTRTIFCCIMCSHLQTNTVHSAYDDRSECYQWSAPRSYRTSGFAFSNTPFPALFYAIWTPSLDAEQRYVWSKPGDIFLNPRLRFGRASGFVQTVVHFLHKRLNTPFSFYWTGLKALQHFVPRLTAEWGFTLTRLNQAIERPLNSDDSIAPESEEGAFAKKVIRRFEATLNLFFDIWEHDPDSTLRSFIKVHREELSTFALQPFGSIRPLRYIPSASEISTYVDYYLLQPFPQPSAQNEIHSFRLSLNTCLENLLGGYKRLGDLYRGSFLFPKNDLFLLEDLSDIDEKDLTIETTHEQYKRIATMLKLMSFDQEAYAYSLQIGAYSEEVIKELRANGVDEEHFPDLAFSRLNFLDFYVRMLGEILVIEKMFTQGPISYREDMKEKWLNTKLSGLHNQALRYLREPSSHLKGIGYGGFFAPFIDHTGHVSENSVCGFITSRFHHYLPSTPAFRPFTRHPSPLSPEHINTVPKEALDRIWKHALKEHLEPFIP